MIYDLAPSPQCAMTATVELGSTEEDVRCLQARLGQVRTNGAAVVVDGQFGPATDSLAREFQAAHALAVDGVAGAQTAELLGIWSPSPEPSPTAVTAAPQLQPAVGSADDIYYANCTEARAAGATDIPRGAPGYRSALDGDYDGLACNS